MEKQNKALAQFTAEEIEELYLWADAQREPTQINQYRLKVALGVKIRTTRKQRGMNRRFFAKKVGLSEKTIQDIEDGNKEHNPSLSTLIVIADFFGMTLTELIGGY